ncbi:molybdate transport system substrate-binding protein [Paraburkholderia caballeronis]|uniref:substrate-binding domain-containing protein n=1 Tax=Paraburkholderia caballeronis TaxID=416943 RepID=UPI00106614CB|nr:substrate-binding domain-containing protein [Paraburkholderia caballeronis]TDV33859.1 molybdate transport system substrate-binding protein [Paraburkholderia caballeronis]
MTSTASDNPSVSLMSTLAVKGALIDTVIPDFIGRTGIGVACTFEPTNVLREQISRGARADLLIATRPYVESLVRGGIADGSTLRPLVRTGIGVAIAATGTHVSLSTVDDLKKLLLDARSVAYSKTGASGVYFATLIRELGIADRVNARATIIPQGFTGECINRGEADVAIQQMSELAVVPGLTIVGPLPEEVQCYTDFSVAGLSSQASSSAGIALQEALFSDGARGAYRRLGLSVF